MKFKIVLDKIKALRSYFFWARQLWHPQKKCAYFFGIPTHSNIGDSAIVVAEKEFLRNCGYDEIVEITSSEYIYNRKCIKRLMPKYASIFLPGGGNMGSLWPLEEEHRYQIIEDFRNCTITVFPQTIFYGDNDNDIKLKNKTATSLAGINLFRIRKKLYSPNMKTVDLKVYFHRKGLNNSYPEDHIQISMTGNPTTSEGVLNFGIDTYTHDFNRYADNEFGLFTLPAEKEMLVEFAEEEDPWIRIDNESGSNTWRVLGGWRPNDPTANGRRQSATLVIRNKGDHSDREEYTVIRRNYGLPVTFLHGVWWCKYNAIKNSKSFDDQILSSADPAAQANKTLFQYLTDCTPEEYYKLWGWAYQGNSGQGMQVIEKDSVIVLERFTRDEKVHINKLPPTTLSPDGYELPSMEEFNRLFDATDYIWMMYNGTHILRNPWNGHSTVKRQQLRKNGIQVGSMTISNLIYIALSSPDFPEHEPLVWYGPAAQWNDTGILHSGHYNNILFGVYSPTGEGWYMNGGMGNLYMVKNGASSYDTRILRFKKSDVEYIY